MNPGLGVRVQDGSQVTGTPGARVGSWAAVPLSELPRYPQADSNDDTYVFSMQ